LTELELVPVFEKLSRDEGEIQNTLLKGMPKFLKNVNPGSRRTYLERLKKLLNPREKWRTRIDYSAIIGEYHSIFDEEITYKQILPICLNFCLDDVSIILI